MRRRLHLSLMGTLLLATVLRAADEPERLLFGGPNRFHASELQAHGARLAATRDRLRIEAAAQAAGGARRCVVFPLRETDRDLSAFRHIELEIANAGAAPVTFTCWALAGPGWGGAPTFSTTKNSSGRETLAPGARGVFRIDLHARYPGREVYAKTIAPAAVRELKIVFEHDAVPVAVELGAIRATGRGSDEPHDALKRVPVPDIAEGEPAPGRRVYQSLPGWEQTEVRHVFTLPREWTPGRTWPVIVEYTGNIFYHKFCHSTGRTEQGHLAHGLARGEKFIVLNLPFISDDGRREQVDGWGDIARTADYCLAAIDFIARQHGADRRAIFFTGFSRGSYAANYLALRDDRIAGVWAGFLTLRNPGAAWPKDRGRGWRGVDAGWDERAARLGARPWFHADDGFGPDVHVDVEFLDDRPSTVATRQWLEAQVARATSAGERGR